MNDTDVKCSDTNRGGSYCVTACAEGMESFVTECNCGKYCKWTSGKPYCFDSADYSYSSYGEDDSVRLDSGGVLPDVTEAVEAIELTTAGSSTTSLMPMADSIEIPTLKEAERGLKLPASPGPARLPLPKPVSVNFAASKVGLGKCTKTDWFSADNCSDRNNENSECRMGDGKFHRRFISTVVTCSCGIDETGKFQCDWMLDDKNLNNKGPKCIRKIKKGTSHK